MRLIKPARFESNCIECHFDKRYREGDVLGGLTVSVPMRGYETQATNIINSLYLTHGILWSLGIAGIGFTYKKQRNYEIKRKEDEDYLRETSLAFDNLNEGLIITDNNINIIALNNAFKNITGYQSHELLNNNLSVIQQHIITDSQFNEIIDCIQNYHRWDGEIEFTNKNDDNIPIKLSISAIYNNENIVSKYIFVFSDISERKDFEKTLTHLAHYDHLTDLPNRLLLNDRLLQAFIRSERQNNSLAVLFLDLDHFKNINDSLGHHIGDKVLVEVSQRLKETIRKQDTLARLSGDEFIIIMESVENEKDISTLANKLIESLSIAFHLDNQEYFLGISIGISLFPKDGRTVADLLSKADIAMYKAKTNGRNNYVYYSPEIDNDFRSKLIIESDLRKAIEQNQFVLHYQPQVCLDTNDIIGVECLVRWQHPTKGLLFPNDFISTIESSGLMVSMGELILEQACIQMRNWLDKGIDVGVIAVNITAQQISHPNFAKDVINCLQKYNINNNKLELEITENYIMQQDKTSIENLNILNDASIHISIDDFGTGYSSLSYLKTLPINKIKIDRSFTSGIPNDPHDIAVINAVTAIGKSLNFRVIAEGVENIEQLNFLIDAECDEYQGYLYSKPISAEDLEKLYWNK